MAICVRIYWVWLSPQISNWWIPYLFGASESYMRIYEREFGRTYKLLPSFSNHPAPDVEPLILQTLILAVVLATSIALYHALGAKKGSDKNAI